MYNQLQDFFNSYNISFESWKKSKEIIIQKD